MSRVLAVSVLCIAAAAGFQAAPVARSQRRQQPSIFASESEPEERKRASEIFTLQERGDGWDDVRGGIKEAIKQREKPYNDIMNDYVNPTRRWTKAIVEVTSETVEELTGVVTPTSSFKMPSVELKKPSLDKEGAISALGDWLDKVAEARAPPPPPPPPEPVRAPANAFLLFGVPAATIVALAAGAVLTSQQ